MSQLRYLIRYTARPPADGRAPLTDADVTDSLERFREDLQGHLSQADGQAAVLADMPFGYQEWRSIFITVHTVLDVPDVDKAVADSAHRHSLKCIRLRRS